MPKFTLGISAFYHDSAAVLLKDQKIIAAVHEERLTRIKHDASFPVNAINFVLKEAGIQVADVDVLAFYDKPYLKFERLLETYHAFAPKGLVSFLSAMPVWIKEKLFMKSEIWKGMEKVNGGKLKTRPELLFPEHHLSHGASAYYPSPFEDAAMLTVDGVGEWATTTISHGSGNQIKVLKELPFPHSIGLLYSAFTYYCGFKVNSGEYKLMGLAPYGHVGSDQVERFEKNILESLIDLKEDGSLFLNMSYFEYATGLKMCNDQKWEKLFGVSKRAGESELTQEYMDLALAIQNVTEKIILKLAKTAQALTGSKNLVMAGGVALNCVANGKLERAGIFENIWIQPAAGDAGGALGAAYAAYYIGLNSPRSVQTPDSMQGSYLGPQFTDADVERLKNAYGANYKKYADFSLLCEDVSDRIVQGDAVGWFQGRAEWGPRALGGRTILGDPRHPDMQKKMNLKIKFREGFRPFAPSVLEEEVSKYFDIQTDSPYMLMVAPVREEFRKPLPKNYWQLEMYDRLYHVRSDIPAITHVDYSARIQSVSKNTNPRYWEVIHAVKKRTGIGMVVNTSFNVRGEPMVCSPEEAYFCFMRTEMDVLVIENCVLIKSEQPPLDDSVDWKKEFALD